MSIGIRGRSGVRARLLWAGCSVAALAAAASGQTWTKITNNPPGAVNLLLLLPDGTVMASANNGSTIGNGWYRLTPDSHGSYISGAWSTLASMADTRLYYSAQVLRDGRVFVAGGEYGTGGARAEVYNPQTNVWTPAPVPLTLMNPSQTSPVTGSGQQFYDANSEILPDGRVIIMPVMPRISGQPLIYDPATNTWAAGPTLVRGGYQDEATWVKLPDSSFVTIDPFGQNSERYYAPTNTWINDGTVPVQMYDSFGHEMGPGGLFPDGRAWMIGATGHTAFYTPSGTAAPGTWAAGPDLPTVPVTGGGQGAPDAPGAMLVTGRMLLTASPAPTSGNHFPSPTRFYEFDPAGAGTYTLVGVPGGGTSLNAATYTQAMLDLPDGTVAWSHFGTAVYAYTPIAGTVQASWKPVVQSVSPNGDGSYHVSGTQLNGISEGASYGDDLQMNSNYPLVRLSDTTGHAYYARTFNWSSTGVMTGAQVVTTEYRLPASLPLAQYSLVVVANGIASDVFCTTPWIDAAGSPGASGVQYVCVGGTLTLSVTGTGTSLSYQWMRGGAPLSDGGTVSGSSTAVLTISPAAASDSASDYACVVSNGCGSVTSTTAVAVVSEGGYANCDGSVQAPVLNVGDFTCFLQRYAQGCP